MFISIGSRIEGKSYIFNRTNRNKSSEKISASSLVSDKKYYSSKNSSVLMIILFCCSRFQNGITLKCYSEINNIILVTIVKIVSLKSYYKKD